MPYSMLRLAQDKRHPVRTIDERVAQSRVPLQSTGRFPLDPGQPDHQCCPSRYTRKIGPLRARRRPKSDPAGTPRLDLTAISRVGPHWHPHLQGLYILFLYAVTATSRTTASRRHPSRLSARRLRARRSKRWTRLGSGPIRHPAVRPAEHHPFLRPSAGPLCLYPITHSRHYASREWIRLWAWTQGRHV